MSLGYPTICHVERIKRTVQCDSSIHQFFSSTISRKVRFEAKDSFATVAA